MKKFAIVWIALLLSLAILPCYAEETEPVVLGAPLTSSAPSVGATAPDAAAPIEPTEPIAPDTPASDVSADSPSGDKVIGEAVVDGSAAGDVITSTGPAEITTGAVVIEPPTAAENTESSEDNEEIKELPVQSSYLNEDDELILVLADGTQYNAGKAKEILSDDVNAEFKFEPQNFVSTLQYMGVGMAGIFIVIGIIVLATVLLNKLFKEKANKAD